MASIDIKLKKLSKIFHEGEKISGTIVIDGRGEVIHSGITLTFEGVVNMKLSSKSVGMFEAFYNSVKPINIIQTVLEIAKPGKFPSGHTEIPFEVNLNPLKNRTMYESYHGVFINITYILKCDMKRSFMNKDLQKTCEITFENLKDGKKIANKEVKFKMSPQAILQTNKKNGEIPVCLITGRINSVHCDITKPFLGEIVVEQCNKKIKSIEMQLVRVETCGCAEGYAKDATEIQNLQIADGDVCRGFEIPINMILPRLFTCPTLETTNFQIAFEINVVVVFADNYILTENFPIKIYR